MPPSSRDCPNIMAIRQSSLDSYAGLRDMAARDVFVLADKISRLIIWYFLQKRDLSDEDKNYLDSSPVEYYQQYGITFDNDTITDEIGAFVEMTVIADWYKVLAENPETKRLSVVWTGGNVSCSFKAASPLCSTSWPRGIAGLYTLRSCKVIDYTLEWVRREEEKLKTPPKPAPALALKKEAPQQAELHVEELPAYDLPDMKQEPTGGPGMVELKAVQDSDDEDEDRPPGR